MSYCAIVIFKDGICHSEGPCLRNAWGGSMRVWKSLFGRYLETPSYNMGHWMAQVGQEGADDPMWDLWKDDRLTNFEKAVLLATFDRAIVRKEHFQKLADDLRAFRTLHPQKLCHLDAWATSLEECEGDAAGWIGTSVTGNLFEEWDEDTESHVPYDLNAQTDHFEVYDALENN